MSQSGKVTPNLNPEGTKTLNLTVLQRIDASIEEILLTVAHVTFYEFNTETVQWSRKDVEGSLFVVKRNTQPRFQFIVMNRRNADNLVENLVGNFEFELQVPYLLYRNAAQKCHGIWFYNEHECEEVGNLISRILNAYTRAPENPKISSKKSEFEKLEAVTSTTAMGGGRKPSSAVPTSTHTQDQSFIDLFNAAMNSANNTSTVLNPIYLHHSSSALPISSKVPSVTSAATVPHISCPSTNHVTNLVNPSSFYKPPASMTPPFPPPVSSSTPTAPAPHPLLNLQHPRGSPLLQTFLPPRPTTSLIPNYALPDGFAISREKVRDALLKLVRDDQFVEMFHQALKKVHQT